MPVPWKRTPWHWSEHVKFRPSWLFQKRCLSLHSWWDAMLARNGTCWVWDVLAFSLLHLSFFGTIASVVLSSGILGRCLHNRRKTTFSYFRGKAFLGKPARCLCHGNEHRGTDPNTSNSGHHDSSRKSCLSLHSWWDAMLARNGTCWVWDVLAFSLLHLSFFGASHRKTLMSSVYLCLFPREGFPRQTYIKAGWLKTPMDQS